MSELLLANVLIFGCFFHILRAILAQNTSAFYFRLSLNIVFVPCKTFSYKIKSPAPATAEGRKSFCCFRDVIL